MTIAGDWEVTLPCSESDDVYGQRCKDGLRNSFALKLAVEGRQVCGLHASVARMGNRVDEAEGPKPSLEGQLSKAVTTIAFQSSFGGTGRARIALKDGLLEWEIVSQDAGEHWLPIRATLLPASSSQWGQGLQCGAKTPPGRIAR
jgi:hypothetical protein